MLSRNGARLQVFLDLRRRHGLIRGPEELVILDEYTIERWWGWVFFYTSRGFRSGNINYAIGGNAPYLVNRDGTIRFAGTAGSIEYYIQEYEAELERKSRAWELYIDEPSNCSLRLASQIRSVLNLSVIELGILKKRLPCVYANGAILDLKPVVDRLKMIGVHCEVRRNQTDNAWQTEDCNDDSVPTVLEEIVLRRGEQ